MVGKISLFYNTYTGEYVCQCCQIPMYRIKMVSLAHQHKNYLFIYVAANDKPNSNYQIKSSNDKEKHDFQHFHDTCMLLEKYCNILHIILTKQFISSLHIINGLRVPR